MRSKSLIMLTTVASVGMSLIVHAAGTDTWALYKSNDGKVPQSDCLEMICEYGCVEKNNQDGYCCPGEGKCRVNGTDDVDLCCGEDGYCSNGTCRKKSCTFGGSTYDDYASVGECGKCFDGFVIQDTSKAAPTCKSTCNTDTWNWNNVADDTKVNECQICRDGQVVNADDGTKLDDCHVCGDGQRVNADDGTRVDHCYECKNGSKVMVANGTTIGDCGKCVTSQVVTWCPIDRRYSSRCHYATVISASRDTSKTPPACKTSCNTTTWLWDNQPDGVQADECNVCMGGEKVPLPDGTAAGECAICQNGAAIPDPNNTDPKCCVHSESEECTPCNVSGTGVRPSADAEYCECPEGYVKRCGSTTTTMDCVDGGTWTCEPGCRDNTDCPTDQECSCNGNNCPASGGTCRPCPEGTHRSESAATQCLPCASCEQWNETTKRCESTCPAGQLCMQAGGYTGRPNTCGGDYCLTMPSRDQLVHKTGSINGRDFYFPRAQGQYRLPHTSASRFCEYYGMHLATVTQACVKDYAYDTGYDCPNFVGIQTFSDRGTSYQMGSWYVDGNGSFWLANMSGNDALRVTYSCGNNHSTNICNGFYPLCTTN